MHLKFSGLSLPLLLSFVVCCLAVAPKGPWDKFNFAPESKVVGPVSIKRINGTVTSPSDLIHDSAQFSTIEGGSWIALDFGKEVMSSFSAPRPSHL
jgi:hypothetical protein